MRAVRVEQQKPRALSILWSSHLPFIWGLCGCAERFQILRCVKDSTVYVCGPAQELASASRDQMVANKHIH